MAEAKRQKTLDRLVEAYLALVDEGKVVAGSFPLNRIWATRAGVKVRTLQKHRAEVLAAVAVKDERRYKDKKE